MLKIPMCLTLFIFGEMFTKSLAVLSIPTRIVFGGRGEAHRGEGPLVALSAEAMSRGPLRPGWGRALSPLWTARSLQGPRISEVGELKLLGGVRSSQGPLSVVGSHSQGSRPGFAAASARGSPAILCASFPSLPADACYQGHRELCESAL